eukprot:Blabericola_migrator_1__8412@NODE_4382_length_1189_cov_22_270053_g2711_i0_p1_GENE_NODE_4382_length_1189_cov_22_270053_g2711_i0NODE_4382_length_1189_cov_22_270053_g2711_i0_p1_ORF_typecomplete_len284_score32_08COPI_assoc/PF08507_10/6_6e21TMEM72/PF16054_5/0_041Shisa/PF13908_6/1_3e03Shisa/PF13908_6/0_42DUF3185/PF11381_8/3_5e03DUF3185/PF11381_8/0_19DUF2371/PF10177_9/1_1e02DUF2371/PF10177_9/1_2Myelin_PLP/PF01275_19/3_2Myelin_PLP/PF01275_19/19_NODE_4382_length_1189_cov_22_270053_g2711_i02531104
MKNIVRPKPHVQVINHNPSQEDYGQLIDEPYFDTNDFSTPLDVFILIVRSLVAVCGCLLMFIGIYSLYPITDNILNLPILTMKLYVVFFGLTILLLEGKNILPSNHINIRKWFYTEFHFLHSIKGKGFYYIFIGSLSLSLTAQHLIFLIAGIIIAVMGILNLTLSCFSKRQLQENYGLSLQDLQTTTKVRGGSTKKHHHHHRQHQGLNTSQEQVAAETEKLLVAGEAYQANNDFGLYSVYPIDSTRERQDHAAMTSEVPLPDFDMTSYSDPLKLAYIQNLRGR